MKNGYYTKGYKNSIELEDGRLLEVYWLTSHLDATFDHTAESEDGEPKVYIDGNATKDYDEELVKKLMCEGYKEDRNWDDID